jgi:aquaporin Z
MFCRENSGYRQRGHAMLKESPIQEFTETEAVLYREWKRSGSHYAEYLAEFGGTAFLMFCVVGVVGFLFASSSPMPTWIPWPVLRLTLAGLMLGGAGWIVAVSPAGRLSGAHINPSVSLGFWILGKMHPRDFLGYVISQMLGGVAGAAVGAVVFHHYGQQVQDALLKPGRSVSRMEAIGLECLATFFMTLVIYTCVSHKSLMRLTPAAAMVTVGILVGLDGSLSGAGMNPARWFGPAWHLHFWADSIVYTLGPLAGAALAAACRRLLPVLHSIPHTGKLFHDPGYRSLFKEDTVPSSPPPLGR